MLTLDFDRERRSADTVGSIDIASLSLNNNGIGVFKTDSVSSRVR
jgi:hypothetical protein